MPLLYSCRFILTKPQYKRLYVYYFILQFSLEFNKLPHCAGFVQLVSHTSIFFKIVREIGCILITPRYIRISYHLIYI